MDRFDLEQAIMAAWHTSDDIELIASMFCDRPEPMSEDELLNLLIGVAHQHNLRSQKLFEIFEVLTEHKIIKDVEDISEQE